MTAPHIYEQETAAEDLRNLLQLCGSWVFLNAYERSHTPGVRVLHDIMKRAESALAKIEHPEDYVCANCGRGHVGHGRTAADQRCPQCAYVEET